MDKALLETLRSSLRFNTYLEVRMPDMFTEVKKEPIKYLLKRASGLPIDFPMYLNAYRPPEGIKLGSEEYKDWMSSFGVLQREVFLSDVEKLHEKYGRLVIETNWENIPQIIIYDDWLE